MKSWVLQWYSSNTVSCGTIRQEYHATVDPSFRPFPSHAYSKVASLSVPTHYYDTPLSIKHQLLCTLIRKKLRSVRVFIYLLDWRKGDRRASRSTNRFDRWSSSDGKATRESSTRQQHWRRMSACMANHRLRSARCTSSIVGSTSGNSIDGFWIPVRLVCE